MFWLFSIELIQTDTLSTPSLTKVIFDDFSLTVEDDGLLYLNTVRTSLLYQQYIGSARPSCRKQNS